MHGLRHTKLLAHVILAHPAVLQTINVGGVTHGGAPVAMASSIRANSQFATIPTALEQALQVFALGVCVDSEFANRSLISVNLPVSYTGEES